LNLFYEVGDAPFGLYWVSPNPVLFEEPFRTRADGSSQTQRFPFTFPIPGVPANKTLDYSIYLPISFSPGYSIHNRMPYAEHYNLSFQRELTPATVLTVSYVGTQGHKLISQYDANPGNQALCLKLSDPANVFPGSPTCGPFGEQATFTLPTGQWDSVNGCTSGCIQGTRDKLGPNFSWNNSYTANIANSNYNAGQISVEHMTNNLKYFCESHREFLRLRAMGEFRELPAEPLAVFLRHEAQLSDQLRLVDTLRSGFKTLRSG
jgi:hypothetical protein